MSFCQNLTLHIIVSGITADDKLNVHKAKDVGQAIIDSMVGKNGYELSFEQNMQAITLASKHLWLSTMSQCKWIHSSCSRGSVL